MIAQFIALALGVLGALGFAAASIALLCDTGGRASPAAAGTAIASALCVIAVALVARGAARG